MRSDTWTGHLVDLDLRQAFTRSSRNVDRLRNSSTRRESERSRNKVACSHEARCSLRTKSDSIRDCSSVSSKALCGHKKEGTASLLRHESCLCVGERSAVNREADVLNVDGYSDRTSQSNTNSSRITNIRPIDRYRVSSGSCGVDRGNGGTARSSSCA